MADTTLPALLDTGTHAGRPAASAVGTGALYSCTDHDLIYQTDGSSWSTWADLAGAAGASVPGWVGDLTGTTTATAFYWDGNDLAGFTEVDVTGTTTWSESNNLASVLVAGMTAEDANCVLIAQSFSTGHAWAVPLMGFMGHTATAAVRAGIIFTDGTTSTSNCVGAHIQIGLAAGGSGDPQTLLVGRHGTLTNMNTAPWVLDGFIAPSPLFFPHLRLTYSASNTFQAAFSPDGITYHAFGEADIAKTMTPTHVGLFVSSTEADGSIFSFGPLRKVA